MKVHLHRIGILIALLLTFSLFIGCKTLEKQKDRETFSFEVIKQQEQTIKSQLPITGPITFKDAMERALTYNLDQQVAKMNEALANRRLTAARFDLLPKLTAAAGYTTRDKIYASSSESILTKQESLEPSTSLDKNRDTVDLTLSWNLLDFGMSYFQMHQLSDRVLIAKERRRKAAQNLMIKVRQAFWNAYGTQKLTDSINEAIIRAEQALDIVGKSGKERLRPPLEDLLFQKQLLVMIRDLEMLRNNMGKAWPVLAALINVPPGQRFELLADEDLQIPELSLSLEEMEVHALKNRPEMVELGYQKKIDILGTKKELTRLLPGIELNAGHHYDSNSFLTNNEWIDGSARISWNLMNIISAPSKMKAAKARENVTRSQTLAISMAVLSQVHVANLDFAMQLIRFKRARALRLIDEQIHSQVKKEHSSKMSSRLDETRALVDVLLAKLHEYNSYAQLQTSYGQVEATIGSTPTDNSL